MTRSRSFWILPQRPDFTGIFAGRRVIPALALMLAGCGGTVSVEEELVTCHD
jgi:hypothetical protein